MAERTEFIIEAKDLLTGQLRGMAGAAHQSLDLVSKDVREVKADLDHLARQGGNDLTSLVREMQHMRSSMDRMAASSRNDFGGLAKDIRRATTELVDMARNSRGTQDAFSGFASKARAEFAGVRREITGLHDDLQRVSRGGGRSGGGIGILDIAGGGLLAQGVTMAAGAVARGVGGTLTAGMDAGVIRSDFETAAGEQGGNKLYGDLSKWIADSIYGAEQYKSANMLLNFGEKPGAVLNDLKMFGDIAGTDKQRMESLALAFGQSMAAGKLQGQDLMQMVQAGFNPMQEMSRTTGRSMADLRAAMERGEISSDMMRGAFESVTSQGGRFYGRSEGLASTAKGMAERMLGNVDLERQKLGERLLPMEERFLKALEPIVNKLPDFSEGLAKLMGNGIDNLTDLLPNIAKVGGSLLDALKPIGELALGDDMKELSKGMLEVTNVLLKTMVPALNLVSKVVGYVANKTGKVAQFAAEGLGNALDDGLDALGLRFRDGELYSAGAPKWAKSVVDNRSALYGEKALKEEIRAYGGYQTWMEDAKQRESFFSSGHFNMSRDVAAARYAYDSMWSGEVKTGGGGGSTTTSVSDGGRSVIGGGARSVVMNFYKELVRQDIKTTGAAETFERGKEAFAEALYRVLNGVASVG